MLLRNYPIPCIYVNSCNISIAPVLDHNVSTVSTPKPSRNEGRHSLDLSAKTKRQPMLDNQYDIELYNYARRTVRTSRIKGV